MAERGFYDPTGTYPRRKELKISEDEGLADKVKGMVSDGLGGILDAEGNKLTGLAEGVDEVDVVYKDENPTSFFEPREDLDEESVLDYAATLLKSFDDFFQINIRFHFFSC